MTIYCDTTFFIGLYVAIDTHSAAALTEWRRLDCPPLAFTPLHRLEVRNAIRQFEFTGDLKPAKVKEVLRCLDEDLADGTLVHQGLDWTGTLKHAERVGEAQTPNTGVRAMDLFHIAAALELRAGLFLTFDDRQRVTAKAAGLKVALPRSSR